MTYHTLLPLLGCLPSDAAAAETTAKQGSYDGRGALVGLWTTAGATAMATAATAMVQWIKEGDRPQAAGKAARGSWLSTEAKWCDTATNYKTRRKLYKCVSIDLILSLLSTMRLCGHSLAPLALTRERACWCA